MLEKAHRTDIPVYAGCDRPLVRPQEVAASIHGQTGLDGVELPVPTRPLEDMHAVNFIVKTIIENEPGAGTRAAARHLPLPRHGRRERDRMRGAHGHLPVR